MDEMWLQLAIGGIGGAGVTGIITNALQGRREHQRWLRDQKRDAYARLLSYASNRRTTSVAKSDTSAALTEIARVIDSGSFETEVHPETVVARMQFRSMGEVLKGRSKITTRHVEESKKQLEAVNDFNEWNGFIDLLAPDSVTVALEDFIKSIGPSVAPEPEYSVDDARALRLAVVSTYRNLQGAIRMDFGTKKKG